MRFRRSCWGNSILVCYGSNMEKLFSWIILSLNTYADNTMNDQKPKSDNWEKEFYDLFMPIYMTVYADIADDHYIRIRDFIRQAIATAVEGEKINTGRIKKRQYEQGVKHERKRIAGLVAQHDYPCSGSECPECYAHNKILHIINDHD